MKIAHKAKRNLHSIVVIFPDCCALASRGNGPMLDFDTLGMTEEEEEQTNPPPRKPRWTRVYTRYNYPTLFATLRHHEDRMKRAEPVLDEEFDVCDQTHSRFCAFCGTALPEPVFTPAPAELKIQRWNDSGYCDTCEKDCGYCRCWHPLIEWDINAPQTEHTP